MPELPEVETVMRGMDARLTGRVVARVDVRRGDLRWKLPAGLAGRLEGALVLGFRRRGKYILMRLEGGDSVLWHLGMSGRIVLERVGEGLLGRVGEGVLERVGGNAPPAAHEHLVLETGDGTRLGFVDPRRFGSVDLVATAAEDRHRLLAGLGPEPLETGFSASVLAAGLAGRRSAVKPVLLDQSVVAGLGNIYVCEALFRARISPFRRAGTVTGARAERLVAAIRAVLTEAIAAGGSSLRDYVQPSGELGYFQASWRVYGREGMGCGGECPLGAGCEGIRRAAQGGRGTFWCGRVQR